jgi:hypothetical protein
MTDSQDNSTQLNERILNSVRKHEQIRKWVTWIAAVTGLMLVSAGMLLALSYRTFIEPKQKQLTEDFAFYEKAASGATNNLASPAPAGSEERRHASNERALAVMSQVLGQSTTYVVSASVALIGFGMLITVLLVVVTYRSTLRQINANLAEISEQIRKSQSP